MEAGAPRAPPPVCLPKHARSSDRGILHGLRGTSRTVCDGRLAKTNTDLVKVLQIRIAQIGITLTNVVDGLVHPLLLIFDFRLKNSTAVHVTEQLVTGSI
jgi:hypothetical protein